MRDQGGEGSRGRENVQTEPSRHNTRLHTQPAPIEHLSDLTQTGSSFKLQTSVRLPSLTGARKILVENPPSQRVTTSPKFKHGLSFFVRRLDRNLEINSNFSSIVNVDFIFFPNDPRTDQFDGNDLKARTID